MFIFVLFASAISIATVAAYFSIYGLANIFTATFWSVVLMGSVLEVGKLVTVSFIYRYWDKITFILKTYLITAVLILMLITSMGIFGYLSHGYQTDSLPLKQMEEKMVLLEEEETRISNRIKQIDEDIGRIGANYITKRMELMEKYKPEKDEILQRQKEIAEEKYKLTNKTLEQKAHVGPIIYIAEALGKPVDNAIRYLVYLIMYAFDPLAVVLTIAANIVIRQKQELKIVSSDQNSSASIQENKSDDCEEVTSFDQEQSPTDEEILEELNVVVDRVNRLHKEVRGNSSVYVDDEPTPSINNSKDLQEFLQNKDSTSDKEP